MSKKKKPDAARSASATIGTPERSSSARGDSEPSAAPPHQDGFRETVESIVIALILAFLFRTFEAEAFEIPTGSMGPTLMGRHKDVNCTKCGFPFQVGVSFEVDDYGRRRYFEAHSPDPKERALAGQPIVAQTCTCPMCRYTMSVDPERTQEEIVDHPLSYSGDRIWVSKAPYALRDPWRWDVVVFKYPQGANQNYIKRFIGLPNETVRIHRGNIYTRRLGEEQFVIARKPPHKVLATLQPVYDNDYLLPQPIEQGWPARWQPIDASAGGWTSDDGGRSFRAAASSGGEAWLAYQHIVPGWDDWQVLEKGQPLPADYQHRPQLVSDFCAYNTGTTLANAPQPEARAVGVHWVGELALDADFEIESPQGEILLTLVEGARQIDCRTDVATGNMQLSIEGLEGFHPRAATAVKGPGKHHIMLANIDDQLLVWVDGSLVEFDQPTTHPELGNARPTEADLKPARIGARGADVHVDHLRLRRDIYYIATRSINQFTDFAHNHAFWDPDSTAPIADFLSTPSAWGAFDRLSSVDFELEEGQFLALGDNSPNSGDSRFWISEHYVARELVIGKAFYVYWPHAWETQPCLAIPFRGRELHVPFYPNFWDMRLIR